VGIKKKRGGTDGETKNWQLENGERKQEGQIDQKREETLNEGEEKREVRAGSKGNGR